MKHSKLITLFFVGSINLFSNSLFAQKKFELSDVAKLTNISDPEISPDGKSIVLVVSRPDYIKNRYNSELVLVDISSKKQRVLTQDRPTVSQPRWSPNGELLAFLSKTGPEKEATVQLFLLSMSGGEARQLTKTPKGVQHYAWNPNSDSIAFATADEPINKKEIEKGYNDFEIENNDMFISSQPTPSNIWLLNIANGGLEKLTSDTWSLPVTIPPGSPSSPLSWSPDGKTILFVKVKTPYSGDGLLRTIQLLNISDNSIKPVSARTKCESFPSFSPDGSNISYWYKKGGINDNINEIWITNTSGDAGKNISEKLNRDIYCSVWMPDGKSLLVGGHDDNKTSLWVLSTNGTNTKIELGDICPSYLYWIDAVVGKTGNIAFTGSEPSHPTELYYLSSAKAKPERLTDFNREVGTMTFGKTETIRWETDGWKNCGILTYPVPYVNSKKYPLVLVIHGGPGSASVEQFSRFSQLLANEGYFVFEPNYRGSDNLGSEYKLAISLDAGPGPGRDVMAGLAKLISSESIDTSKIGVSGWSYGGYMTVWLAGHYSGWKAVVSGAAVTDWVDQYDLSDNNIRGRGIVWGSPWVGNNMQKYIDQSPITEAKNIKAPTLILANNADPRVPITQSYKLYHSLIDNGTLAKFVAWPIPAHTASDPVTQMERDRLWISWFNKYLK
jgi:dipeptidyl aminopeptidase/acylaminoacyl peptidase